MPKAKVKRISIKRCEGPIAECVDYTTEYNPESGVTGLWSRINHTLSRWGETAPVDGVGGYDKCDVIVEWENGMTLRTRFDLVHGGTTHNGLSLRTAVSNEVMFYAGEWCPPHAVKHQEAILARFPERTERMKEIFENCQL